MRRLKSLQTNLPGKQPVHPINGRTFYHLEPSLLATLGHPLNAFGNNYQAILSTMVWRADWLLYSITSSARSSIDGGIVIPSA